mgnify:CR=1 FL=1
MGQYLTLLSLLRFKAKGFKGLELVKIHFLLETCLPFKENIFMTLKKSINDVFRPMSEKDQEGLLYLMRSWKGEGFSRG